ncbi:MAG: hypothetical protein ACOCP8_03655 [archaeon]
MIINEKILQEDCNLLKKNELAKVLSIDANKYKKDELIKKVVNLLANDESKIKKFYKNNIDCFALSPTKIEQILSCTKAERKRWEKEGLLPVIGKREFAKYGKILEYSVFDRYLTYKIKQEELNEWREKQKLKVEKNRKEGIKKGTITKKENNKKRKKAHQEMQKKFKNWYNIDEKLGVTLELAYWTLWISRWAKQKRVKQTTTEQRGFNLDKYYSEEKTLYEYKNKAVKLLINSEYKKLSFYRPTEHRKNYVRFCQEHYDDWNYSGEYNPWDFYKKNSELIESCPDCYYYSEEDYFSLFYLEIKNDKVPDYTFSFHTPYPVGKEFFPEAEKLEQVLHKENEGLFRFGRSLFEEEKIIYTEKTVEKNFKKALSKFKDIYKL